MKKITPIEIEFLDTKERFFIIHDTENRPKKKEMESLPNSFYHPNDGMLCGKYLNKTLALYEKQDGKYYYVGFMEPDGTFGINGASWLFMQYCTLLVHDRARGLI